jgi:hypothetical protein
MAASCIRGASSHQKPFGRQRGIVSPGRRWDVSGTGPGRPGLIDGRDDPSETPSMGYSRQDSSKRAVALWLTLVASQMMSALVGLVQTLAGHADGVCAGGACAECSSWTAAIAEARAISCTASRVSAAPVGVGCVIAVHVEPSSPYSARTCIQSPLLSRHNFWWICGTCGLGCSCRCWDNTLQAAWALQENHTSGSPLDRIADQLN